jgi:CubicO group peptidase (beta-lactamase class C family)
LAQIDAMVAAEFSRKPVDSVTVGVVSGNQFIWTNSYGSADMEKRLPADKDTVYRIGSVTKMFTAVMLDQLVEAGKVHLSDPVRRYFPEIALVQGKCSNAPPITYFSSPRIRRDWAGNQMTWTGMIKANCGLGKDADRRPAAPSLCR